MRDRTIAALSLVLGGIVAAPSAFGGGQEPPPIPGETGTIALDGTVAKTYAGIHAIAVKTADGIEHLIHLTSRTAVHGVNDTTDALNGLSEGTRVVVHYAPAAGDATAVEVDRIASDGLHEMHGVVTHVDRPAKRLTIRLEDGSTETLRLSDRAARNSGRDVRDASTVVVYYLDEDGDKVAHYFKAVRPD